MNRHELVRLFVLDSICDDYENVDQIVFDEVAKQGAKCGLKIDRPEVVDALAGLIEDGLAKAYILSNTQTTEVQGMPALDTVEKDFVTYFRITKKGMDLQLSDVPGWPFDDASNLRPGWRLDSA